MTNADSLDLYRVQMHEVGECHELETCYLCDDAEARKDMEGEE